MKRKRPQEPPELDPDVQRIMYRFFETLGRQPTQGEWQRFWGLVYAMICRVPPEEGDKWDDVDWEMFSDEIFEKMMSADEWTPLSA